MRGKIYKGIQDLPAFARLQGNLFPRLWLIAHRHKNGLETEKPIFLDFASIPAGIYAPAETK